MFIILNIDTQRGAHVSSVVKSENGGMNIKCFVKNFCFPICQNVAGGCYCITIMKYTKFLSQFAKKENLQGQDTKFLQNSWENTCARVSF